MREDWTAPTTTRVARGACKRIGLLPTTTRMALCANVAMAATVERAVAERWCGAPYGSLFVTASNRPSRAAAAASERSPVVADVERREEGARAPPARLLLPAPRPSAHPAAPDLALHSLFEDVRKGGSGSGSAVSRFAAAESAVSCASLRENDRRGRRLAARRPWRGGQNDRRGRRLAAAVDRRREPSAVGGRRRGRGGCGESRRSREVVVAVAKRSHRQWWWRWCGSDVDPCLLRREEVRSALLQLQVYSSCLNVRDPSRARPRARQYATCERCFAVCQDAREITRRPSAPGSLWSSFSRRRVEVEGGRGEEGADGS